MFSECQKRVVTEQKSHQTLSVLDKNNRERTYSTLNKTIVYSEKKMTTKSMVMHPALSTSLEYAKKLEATAKQKRQKSPRGKNQWFRGNEGQKGREKRKFMFSNKQIQLKLKQEQFEEYLRSKIEHLKLYCESEEKEFNKLLQLKKKKHYKIRNMQLRPVS